MNHYVQALTIRRLAHQMGAIFGGRMPTPPVFVPGGCSRGGHDGQDQRLQHSAGADHDLHQQRHDPRHGVVGQHVFPPTRDSAEAAATCWRSGCSTRMRPARRNCCKRGRLTNGDARRRRSRADLRVRQQLVLRGGRRQSQSGPGHHHAPGRQAGRLLLDQGAAVTCRRRMKRGRWRGCGSMAITGTASP